MGIVKQKNKRRVENPVITKTIGQNVKALRLEAGFTQSHVAVVLGVTFQQVQKYEKGTNRLPAEKLYRLKHLFDVPFSAFFDGIPPKNKD